MADRTVTVRLDADIKPYLAALAKAEAATKRFRDGLGKGMPDPFEPWDEETDKRKKRAPKDGEQIAGAFARSFSRRLEAAFQSLPKAKLDADASAAQKRLQEVRASLQTLSAKQIGVDIDADTAVGEIKDLETELERLALLGDITVKADTAAALAQLRTIEQEVDKLNGVQPTVQPEVDAAQARAQLDDLQRRLADLQERRRLGVDLDDGAARSEINAIQRDLERLNASSADPSIRVDSASALAQVRTVQSEMARVDGRSAKVKVDADVGGALRNIAMIAAALASLPSAVSIGVGVAGLGAAFAAAGAGAAGFAAVAIPGISRVTEALKQAESAGGGAGGAMKSAAQKAAEAASSALRLAEAQDRVKDSAQAVKSAQQAVRDAMSGVRSAQQDVARAAEDSAERQAQASARIADAERSVQDAHRATQRAIEDLTRARERAQERIEDLALATEGGALSEERALLSIKRAQADLARVNADNKSSQLDKDDAALRLKEAEFNLKRIREANGDLAKEQADSDKKGIEGSDEVVAAKERILDAQQREADAERALADARAESARVARDGARDVADANQRVADAQRKVADAQQALVKAQRDHLRAVQALKIEQLQQKAALDQASSSAGKTASKMSELSTEERKLADAIKDFQDDYVAWQRSLQPDVFPVIEKGLDVLRVGMDRATPLVKGGAEGLDRFADSAKKALESKEWTDFFDDLGKKAPDAIEGLGNAALNVAGGLRGVVDAFLPYTGQLTDWVEDITQDFEDWGTKLKDSPEFREFLEYAKENGPKVAEIVGNLAEFIGKIASVGAGIGPGVLDFLVSLSEKLASLQPDQIDALAKGVAAIFAAAKLGTAIKLGGFILLADVLSKMSPGQIQALAIAIAATVTAVKGYQAISGAAEWWHSLSGGIDKAGKSAGDASGKLSAMSGLFKGGVIAGSITAVAFAFDKVADSLDGLNPDVEELSRSMQSFLNTGKPTGAFLDQLNPKLQSTIGRFETFGESAARLASDNPFEKISESVSGLIDDNLGIQLDGGRQALDNLDQQLAAMVNAGNAEQAAKLFQFLAQQAQAAGVPVDKLQALLPNYSSAAAAAQQATAPTGDALKDLGNSASGAANDVNTLHSAISQLTSLTATAMQAEINYKRAVDDTAASIRENGRAHDTNSEAGRRNREALIGLAEKANAYRDALIEQGTPLDEVTRKVGAQRDQFITLAEKMGFSRQQAEELATKLGLIPGNVKTDVKTPGGKEALDLIKEYEKKLRELDGKTVTTTVREYYIRKQDNLKARAGGIFAYAEGGIQKFAAGGRSTPPNMATGPTILYGEGADQEAFIPYESKYRSRAIDLLSQVASDFGLEVYSARASQQVQSLTGAIDATNMQVGTGLTAATGALEGTLGQAGSLTSAITQVGSTAEQLDQSWLSGSQVIGDTITLLGDGVADMSTTVATSVDGLSESVYQLTQTMGSIKDGAAAKTSAGSKAGSKPGAVGATATKSMGTFKKTGGFVQGNQPVNSSRVSAPQKMPAFYSASTGQPGAETVKGPAAASSAGRTGSLINVENLNVNNRSDADQAAAYLYARLGSKGPG